MRMRTSIPYGITATFFLAACGGELSELPPELLEDSSELTGRGLQGDYYDNTNLTALKVSRLDSTVDFDWQTGAPATGVASDTFSVRWTGTVTPRFTEAYTFYVESDDGATLVVNGQTLVNAWYDHGAQEMRGTINLVANRAYAIELRYYDNGGRASCKLRWSSAHEPKAIVPSTALAAPGGATTPPTSTGGVKWYPGNYELTTHPTQLGEVNRALASPSMVGIQLRAFWGRPGEELEPQKGVYDFSTLESVLRTYSSHGKRLHVLLMEQDYWGQECVPAYMRDPRAPGYSPIYQGGSVRSGSRCVPKIWIPAVMDRMIALWIALGRRFDAEPYFAAISSGEISVPGLGDPSFSNEALVTQVRRLQEAMARAFPHTVAFMGMNWAPSTEALVANAYNLGLGIDGPDLLVTNLPATSGSWGYPCINHLLNRPVYGSATCSHDYYQRMPLGMGGQVGLERSIKAGFSMQQIYDFAMRSPTGLRLNFMAWSQPYETPGFSFNGTILPFIESVRGAQVNTVCPENLVRFRGGCRR